MGAWVIFSSKFEVMFVKDCCFALSEGERVPCKTLKGGTLSHPLTMEESLTSMNPKVHRDQTMHNMLFYMPLLG